MKTLGKCIDIIKDWDNRDSFDRADVARTLRDLFKTEPVIRQNIADMLENLTAEGLLSKDEIIHRPFGKC